MKVWPFKLRRSLFVENPRIAKAIKEIQTELTRNPQLFFEVKSNLNEKKGRALLSNLLDESQMPAVKRSASKIVYH